MADPDATDAPATIGDVDPLQFVLLGAAAIGGLALAQFATGIVFLQFEDVFVFSIEEPYGFGTEPSDLHLAVGRAYRLAIQTAPLVAVLLGFVVPGPGEDRTADAVGALAVAGGAAVALFLFGLFYTVTAPEGTSLDSVSVLEPAVAATVGVIVGCFGGAAAIRTVGAVESPW